MPGDKSISHRAVLLGAICRGRDADHRTSAARPTPRRRSRRCARSGSRSTSTATDTLHVFGKGLRGLVAPGRPIDCAQRRHARAPARGHPRRARTGSSSSSPATRRSAPRPMKRITEPLGRMGAGVETEDGHLPLGHRGAAAAVDHVRAARRERAGEVGDPARRPVREGRDDGRRAGADPRPHRADARGRRRVDHAPREERHDPARRAARARARSRCPGDFSSAAPFIVAATLVPGSELHIHGVNLNPRRTGLLDDPRADGRAGDGLQPPQDRRASGRATSRCARPSSSRRRCSADEVPLAIDELPLFALAASCAHGDSRLRGAEELRAKESDRVEATVDALRALGQHVLATEDGFRIRGVPTRPRGGRIDEPRRPPDRDARRRRGARLPGGGRDRGRRVRGSKLSGLLRAAEPTQTRRAPT